MITQRRVVEVVFPAVRQKVARRPPIEAGAVKKYAKKFWRALKENERWKIGKNPNGNVAFSVERRISIKGRPTNIFIKVHRGDTS